MRGDDRVVRLLRDQVFDRVHLGEHLGERLVRVEVQLDVDLDRRGALHRRRGDVVDALGGGDRLLDRRGDEALDQVRGCAGIDGRDVDDRVRAAGVQSDDVVACAPGNDQLPCPVDRGGLREVDGAVIILEQRSVDLIPKPIIRMHILVWPLGFSGGALQQPAA